MSVTNNNYFDSVNPKADFFQMEDELIASWKKNKIFEKSLKLRDKSPHWTFLDGPPFVTGMPHYGTLLSSIPKDLFPRYWTMKGYKVRRVWGWDGHGLPIENKVEKELGIQRKKDIETKVGVDKFIAKCFEYVSKVSGEWEWYVDHIGRWVDFKNAYKTWDIPYMESVMWVFKQMYEKGYVYKGLRISLFCPHCSTPISNFEVAMDPENYKDITEPSNTYKYEILDNKSKEKTYLLAWSTTPWTKITTTALAVNPNYTYVKVNSDGENYILAKSTLKNVFKSKKHTVVEEFKGEKLIGLNFVGHYDFFEREKGKNCFVVIGGDFVTSEEGTGIVTIAPYGQEDLEVMQKENIQVVLHVDEEGKFTENVPNWGGLFYAKANSLINEDLKGRGLLFDEKQITHSVATCWRCHERLIYAPQDAWYVDVQTLKPRLKENNEKINWYPKHFKHGRFLKSMESAPDWCISRSRYWGSPVPVWECSCGERFVPGSIAELEEASGTKITNLHKPEIDNILVTCKKCGKRAKRVPEVLDSWIEAGSASFAERHYPFNEKHNLEDFFPPDFIVEYTGQIRAWFYVLHVIGTAVFDSSAFKNVLVTGVILGTDNRKMSKNFGNYPDPQETIKKYGGDALRLYLMGTPVMKAEDIAISEEQYRNEVKNYLLTLWNTYNYFITYANLEEWKPSKKENKKEIGKNILDAWINARLTQTTLEVEKNLEKYDTVGYVDTLKAFVLDLSTWYLRRSRERSDREGFYSTMYEVLKKFAQISAPITPFVSEKIYTNLTKEESVHLTDWPKDKLSTKEKKEEDEIIREMKRARLIVEAGHALRKESAVPVRQPLLAFEVKEKPVLKEFEELIKEELNVKNIVWDSKKNNLNLTITPQLEEEAKTRELIRKIQEERKSLGVSLKDEINLVSDWLPTDEKLLEWLKKKTLVKGILKGDFSVTIA